MLTEKRWRPEAVLFFCAGQGLCFCLGGLAVFLLDKTGWAAFKLSADSGTQPGFGAIVISTLSFQGATLVLTGIFLWYHQQDWREFFGLRDPQWKRAVGWAVMTAIVLLPVLWLLEQGSIALLTHFGYKTEDEMAVQMVENATSIGGQIYMGFFAIVLAPVAEEFIFRGLLFPAIRQAGFPRLAWVGVSALFALIHWNAETLVPLFVLALTLTSLYVKTGNLLAPITAHAFFNAVNFAALIWESYHPGS